MPKVRTTILTSIMAPHRIALFNALAALPDIDLTVVYLARSDPSRRWATYEREMRYPHALLHEHLRVRRGQSYVHVTSGLASELRQTRPHVIVGGGWDQFAYHEARLLSRALGARFLWWVESNLRDRRPERPSLRWLKERLLAGVDGVVVPGSASVEYVRHLGASPERVWLAPNAVDNQLYRSDIDRADRGGPVRFLFAGRLDPAKGLATLLDAWTCMRGDVELMIVGSGSLDEAVRRRIDVASMPAVRLLGHQDRDQLVERYRQADVFVFPSVSDPWGLVVNEAMASGLPIVAASAAGAVDDLVCDGDNGLVVPPLDPGRLSGALQSLADDAPRRLAMGARSSDRIRDFEPGDWADGMRTAVLSVAGAEGS